MNIALQFRPGVNSLATSLSDEGTFDVASLVRFLPDGAGHVWLQKVGGWTQLSQSPVIGTARGMHAFVDLATNSYIGIGSEQVLQIYNNGLISEITPIVKTSNVMAAFTTDGGHTRIVVADPLHGQSPGNWIYISTLTFVGGLFLQGLYQITDVVDAGHYAINAASVAPVSASGGAVLTFSTTSGSSLVTISDGGTFQAGQSILIYNLTLVGGLALSGPYVVQINGGNAQIQAAGSASASASASENAGAIQILYLFPASVDPTSSFVFGAGPFGAGAFGVGGGASVGQELGTRQWSIDNFGQIMLAAPTGGPIMQWVPPISFSNRATVVPAPAPQFSTQIMVAMPQQQVISLGSDAGGFQDPLLVRFSDVGTYSGGNSWTATATNQAGSYRLTSGARIVGGLQGPQQGYIWTDIGLWTMNYIGFPFVYGFNNVANGCGLLAMRACGIVGGRLIWVGKNGFWEFDGQTVRPLPCPVRDFMFASLDRSFDRSVHIGLNSDFTEAWIFFPSHGTYGLPTSYVKFNATTNIWDQGVLTRTSMIDRTDIAPVVGVDGANGFLQAHEVAPDANGQPMPSYARTGWFKLADGHDYIFLERILPDFVINAGATVGITVEIVKYQGDTPRVFGPYTVSATTQNLIVRGRGRFIRFRFDFSALTGALRIGTPIARIQAAGSR